jgi:hypothetical protein
MNARISIAVASIAVATLAGGCAGEDGDPAADSVATWLLQRQADAAQQIEDQAASGELAGQDLEHMREALKAATLSEKEADCYARTMVEKLGAERVTDMGFTGSPPSSDYRPGPNEKAALLAAEHCRHDWKTRVFKYQTEGSDRISDASLECMTDSVTDEEAEHMAKVLADFQPGPELDEVMALYEKCLTPEELDGLDWN